MYPVWLQHTETNGIWQQWCSSWCHSSTYCFLAMNMNANLWIKRQDDWKNIRKIILQLFCVCSQNFCFPLRTQFLGFKSKTTNIKYILTIFFFFLLSFKLVRSCIYLVKHYVMCVSETGLRESAGFGSESAGVHCARCLWVCVCVCLCASWFKGKLTRLAF